MGPALALVSAPLCAQPSFTITDGGPYAQVGVGVIENGGGYAVAVRTYGPTQGHRAEIRTYNAQGALQATLPFGPAGNVFIQAMVPAPGGGAYVVGSIIPPDSTDQDALVIRLNSAFGVVWTSTPALPNGQVLHDATVLADGRLAATGTVSGSDKHDALVMCFSTTGALDWWSTVPGPLDEEGYGIASDPGGIMITGRQMGYSGTSDCLFAYHDLSGNLLWATSWGGIRNDVGRALVRTSGGSYIMAGGSDSFSAFDTALQRFPEEVHLIAIDTNGDTLWTRSEGAPLQQQNAGTLSIASNGDLFIAGERWVNGQRDALVMRTSPLGAPIWDRTRDIGLQDAPWSVQALPNGCVATGSSMTGLGQQVLLVRLNASGN